MLLIVVNTDDDNDVHDADEWWWCWLGRPVQLCGRLLLRTSVYLLYDAVSANVVIWVLKMGESESGQMVSEKVKWA